MTVKIVPKTKIKTQSSRLHSFLFYFSLILLFISASTYLALDFYFLKNSSQRLEEVKKEFIDKESPQKKVLEKQVLTYQEKIEDFSLLFNDHRYSSKLFTLIESSCHPQVWFSSFSVNFEESTISLPGEAKSFRVLEEQIFAFKKQNFIKEVDLSDLSLGEEGKIDFSLNLSFHPEVLK